MPTAPGQPQGIAPTGEGMDSRQWRIFDPVGVGNDGSGIGMSCGVMGGCSGGMDSCLRRNDGVKSGNDGREGVTLTLTLSRRGALTAPQGRGDWTPHPVPFGRPFDSAQGERNPHPRGVMEGRGDG